MKQFHWIWDKCQANIGDVDEKHPAYLISDRWMKDSNTLQGTNISHLGKRKIIFKTALEKGYVSSQEGIFFWCFFSKATQLGEELSHLNSTVEDASAQWP